MVPLVSGGYRATEKVQRRAVNFITGLQGVTYEEKLKERGLQSLETRRINADLILVYKSCKGWLMWIITYGLTILAQLFQGKQEIHRSTTFFRNESEQG